MATLNSILSPELIRAFGWTLIHSLWQGTLIALIAGLALLILKKNSAWIRYLVLFVSLLLILGVSGLTFFRIYSDSDLSVKRSVNIENLLPVAGETATAYKNLAENSGIIPSSWLKKTYQMFEYQAPLLVLLWFIGFVIFFLKYLGGIIYAQRIKNYRNFPVSEEWTQKLRMLCDKIGFRKNVKLAESALVNIPIVIGTLSPVILLPIGTISGVPAAQLEAILLHELAHIYRKDYFLNLIQSFIEALFFFHPAVWWLSQGIRQEREHICDDIALKHSKDPLNYIKALTQMENKAENKPVLATAFSGKKQHLLNRVRRLIEARAFGPGMADNFIAPLILLFAIITLTATAAISFEKRDGKLLIPEFNKVSEPMSVAISDNVSREGTVEKVTEIRLSTGVSTVQKTNKVSAATSVIKSNQNGQIYFLPTGFTLPDTLDAATRKQIEQQIEKARQANEQAMQQMKEAREQTKQAREQMKEALKQENMGMNQEFREKLREQLENLREQTDSLNVYNFSFKGPEDFNFDFDWNGNEFQPCPGDTNGNIFYFDSHDFDTLIRNPGSREIIIDRDRLKRDIDRSRKEIREYSKGAPQWKQERKYMYFDQNENAPYVLVPPVQPLPRVAPVPDLMEFYHRNPTEKIIRQELRNDGLIKGGESYVIELNSGNMYINGEKQARDVFKKYKRLYESLEDQELNANNAYKLVF